MTWDGEYWNRAMEATKPHDQERPDHHVNCGIGPGSRCFIECPCPCHLNPTDWAGIHADILMEIPK